MYICHIELDARKKNKVRYEGREHAGDRWIFCFQNESGRPLMTRKLNKMREQLLRNWQWGMCQENQE